MMRQTPHSPPHPPQHREGGSHLSLSGPPTGPPSGPGSSCRADAAAATTATASILAAPRRRHEPSCGQSASADRPRTRRPEPAVDRNDYGAPSHPPHLRGEHEFTISDFFAAAGHPKPIDRRRGARDKSASVAPFATQAGSPSLTRRYANEFADGTTHSGGPLTTTSTTQHATPGNGKLSRLPPQPPRMATGDGPLVPTTSTHRRTLPPTTEWRRPPMPGPIRP